MAMPGGLLLFKTAWGSGDLASMLRQAQEACFDGIEAPAPVDPAERAAFFAAVRASGLAWIAEVSTCTPAGKYVPQPRLSVVEHLESLREGVERSLEGSAAGASPLFVNTMAGSDSWSAAEALEFHTGVVRLQEKLGVTVSVETHRGRYSYSPWLMRDVLLALPSLRITADLSHWCVVSERFVLDNEPELLALVAKHVHHLQPRVGYSQGPQVPDPRAPEHADALAAHERWWDALWDGMAARGYKQCTATPEFGPDGYLQCAPFTRKPVADLWELNKWIGHRQRQRFNAKFGVRAQACRALPRAPTPRRAPLRAPQPLRIAF